MNLIVCVDENWGIGYDGKLLYSIPEDMKFFREKTKDSILVMGLNTLYSFKDKAPLKGRINIVFAPDVDIKQNEYKNYDNIIFINDKNKIKEISDQYKNKEVYVIGGASIYNYLYKDCDKLYITKMYKKFDKVDTYFPNIENEGYNIIEKSEMYIHKNENEEFGYQFLTYKK